MYLNTYFQKIDGPLSQFQRGPTTFCPQQTFCHKSRFFVPLCSATTTTMNYKQVFLTAFLVSYICKHVRAGVCSKLMCLVDPYYCAGSMSTWMLSTLDAAVACGADHLAEEAQEPDDNNRLLRAVSRQAQDRCSRCERSCHGVQEPYWCRGFCAVYCHNDRNLHEVSTNETANELDSPRHVEKATVDQKHRLTSIGTDTSIDNMIPDVNWYKKYGLKRRELFADCKPHRHVFIANACLNSMFLVHSPGCKFTDAVDPDKSTPTSDVTKIKGFTLIDAKIDKDLAPLRNGDIIDLSSSLHSKYLSLRADVTGIVGSIRFELDGVVYKVENNFPFALGGNKKRDNYRPVPELRQVGTHKVSATLHSGKDGSGDVQSSITITFKVSDRGI